MNKATACIFPETLPSESLLFPLVQVFGQLVYLQAVEDEPLETGLPTPYAGHLLQQGTLQLFTPAPLGEQRERFLALTGDMQNRRDDYTSQLSMLTLAGLSRREQTETKNSILTNLLKSGKIDSRNEEEELLLWQSRLMLKLGEFFDAEQAELNEALRNISSRQDNLLAVLREETDNPFSLTAGLQDYSHKAETILQHRLRAWSRLYFHGTPPTQPQIFITSHEAVLDTLQEVYAKNRRQGARQVASLELPAKRNPAAELSSMHPLISQCSALQAALTALTGMNAFTPPQMETIEKLFSECATDWSQHTATLYPSAQHGRCTLDLFLFPEISPRQLFLESFAGSSPAMDDKSLTTCPGTLVGLLKMDGNSA
jgi:hypothetical protein